MSAEHGGVSDRYVVCLMIAVLTTGSFNHVLSQIRAKSLVHYNYLTALMNAFVYAVFWSAVAIFRVRRGYADLHSVRYLYGERGAWRLLALAGLGEAFSQIFSFIGQPHLSLPLFQLSSQFIILFTVVFSSLLLQARYICGELLAVVVIITGMLVLIAEMDDDRLSEIGYMLLVSLSTAGGALSFVLKELVFRNFAAEERPRGDAVELGNSFAGDTSLKERLPSAQSGLQGGRSRDRPTATPTARNLDAFLVSSCTSIFGFLLSFPMIPVNVIFHKTEDKNLFEFFSDGFTCLGNTVPDSDVEALCSQPPCFPCQFAWQSYVLYIMVNLAYNLMLLVLVKNGSALLAFLSLKGITPCALFLSLVTWKVGPIILPAAELGPHGWISAVLILLGIAMFRIENVVREKLPERASKCFWPLWS